MDAKLPFIHEIFQGFKKFNDCDVFVYTNADIMINPYFYTMIKPWLKGRDAATVLRNDILDGELKKHPGYDCFVFRSSLLEKIELPRNVFLGYPPVGNCIMDALRAATDKPVNVIPARDRFTSHIGDDQQWKDHPYVKINQDYAKETPELL